jgi:hypothetical protein
MNKPEAALEGMWKRSRKLTLQEEVEAQQADLKCPRCGWEVFERMMDARVVDKAYYDDGKLCVVQTSYKVNESNICCEKCKYEFDDDDELQAEIEELFM